MATEKLSGFSSGGQIAGATDKVVVVRSGNTDLLVNDVSLTWYNVQANGVLPANSAATNSTNIAALITTLHGLTQNSGTLYFPSGNYNFSSAIDVSSLNWVHIIGDGWESGNNTSTGTTLSGNFAGNLMNANFGSGVGTVFISRISLSNTNAAGVCLYQANGAQSTFDIVEFSCQGATSVGFHDFGSFTTSIRNCKFSSGGANGIGFLMETGGGSCTLTNCDFSGWSECIRASGSGLNMFGGRGETNHIFLNLGMNPAGGNAALNRSSFQGVTGEANDYAIQLPSCTDTLFAGCVMQGSTNAPSGNSITGLTCNGASQCTFISCDWSGTYTTGASVTSGNNTFIGVTAASWSINNSPGLAFINMPGIGYGLGMPTIVAAVQVTGQSAANSSIATFQSPNTGTTADYEVGGTVTVSAASAISTTLTCAYTDAGGNSVTLTLPLIKVGTTTFLTNGLIITTGTYVATPVHINCQKNGHITIATSTGTFTGVTYSATGVIKQLQ